MTKEIFDDEQKKKISRAILESLKEWFEVDSSREAYIQDSPGKLFFASFDGEKPNGFLYLKKNRLKHGGACGYGRSKRVPPKGNRPRIV